MKEAFSIEIESLDLEGRGVGHRDGKVVFVEGALPGERVLAAPVKVKASYETARATEVLRESTLRVRPVCPHFGIGPGFCGGCAMQHLEPRAQVAVKQRVLEDALWHIGRVRPQQMLRPIHGPTWGYRYRARLAVRHVARKGGVLVGFHERGSSYVADMRECHVLPAHLSRLLLPLRELVESLSIRDRLPQIEVAVAEHAGVVHTALVFRHLLPLSEGDRASLAAFGRAHDVAPWLQSAGPDTAVPLDPADASRLLLGLPQFGVSVPFAPTDFTQVNHRINEVLVGRAVGLLDLRSHESVADFFCGLGNFTLPLATRARQVVGIEGHAGLVARARQAAERAGLAHKTRFEARNLFDWTRADWDRLNGEAGPIDAVLVDPPREGALALAQSLAQSTLQPRRMVYVSCNPATLARDCAVLVNEGGWQLAAAGVVNMFPHTAHVESMAVLEPGSATAPVV
ncbi:MAG: 23S rRNA (uracil(1939)-C(5))-methyltransferase RlmD [Burkholderiaceae bacterium]|jgi:23S rRNA (uracil1939-C5)-methyltransferase|nr:23S rRNA (uracil(1939)-C(5))-methyltransferase RlmD [Burkholderiaceae bacterium]